MSMSIPEIWPPAWHEAMKANHPCTAIMGSKSIVYRFVKAEHRDAARSMTLLLGLHVDVRDNSPDSFRPFTLEVFYGHNN